MTGTPTPRSRSLRTISGTAAAAGSLLTVTRTSSLPAWASRATWIAVPSASAVSVLVIDWTTTGWALPTVHPADVDRDGLRDGRVALIGRGRQAAEPDDVEAGDPQDEGHQNDEPDGVGQALGAQADPRAEQRA